MTHEAFRLDPTRSPEANLAAATANLTLMVRETAKRARSLGAGDAHHPRPYNRQIPGYLGDAFEAFCRAAMLVVEPDTEPGDRPDACDLGETFGRRLDVNAEHLPDLIAHDRATHRAQVAA